MGEDEREFYNLCTFLLSSIIEYPGKRHRLRNARELARFVLTLLIFELSKAHAPVPCLLNDQGCSQQPSRSLLAG